MHQPLITGSSSHKKGTDVILAGGHIQTTGPTPGQQVKIILYNNTSISC